MVFAALSFGTSVLPVYQSLCPHSSFKQKAHLHQNKARQILSNVKKNNFRNCAVRHRTSYGRHRKNCGSYFLHITKLILNTYL